MGLKISGNKADRTNHIVSDESMLMSIVLFVSEELSFLLEHVKLMILSHVTVIMVLPILVKKIPLLTQIKRIIELYFDNKKKLKKKFFFFVLLESNRRFC